MTQGNKSAVKTKSYNQILVTDSRTLTVVHRETKRVHLKLSTYAANDSLYSELEARYGGSFAQGIVDQMHSVIAKEKT